MQHDSANPALEGLYAEARAQNALLLALALLVVPLALTLIFADDVYIGERRFAAGAVALLLPILSFRGWAADNPTAGHAVAGITAAVGCFVGTGQLWVAVLGAAFALGAAYAFYRVSNNAAYRPRLHPRALQRAGLSMADTGTGHSQGQRDP